MRTAWQSIAVVTGVSLLGLVTVPSCDRSPEPVDCANGATAQSAECDDAFAALQQRGATAMGVDQYTSTHVFEALPDGGRIELQRDVEDPTGIEVIRSHLQGIADAFGRGDFRAPGFVHDGEVPGTNIMAERRARITYTYSALPRGGEVRIVTTDPKAIAAIHAFLAFQRGDHRTGEHR